MPSRGYLFRLFIKMFMLLTYMGFPGGSNGKESACSAVDPDSIPWSEKSPGEGKYGSEKNKVLCVKVKKVKGIIYPSLRSSQLFVAVVGQRRVQ